MFINKIGMDHIELGINCQDAGCFVKEEDSGYYNGSFAIICDGCSEGVHSEVGSKTFTYLVKQSALSTGFFNSADNFSKMVNLYGNDPDTLRDYLSFTIFILEKKSDIFHVSYCGDGFLILQDNDGNIMFDKLTDGEYPKYLVYNFANKSNLKCYKDGVKFENFYTDKSKYMNVGIASDGIRFILECADEDLKLRDEFVEILKSGKEAKMKRFINKNHRLFKDDVTIAF